MVGGGVKLLKEVFLSFSCSKCVPSNQGLKLQEDMNFFKHSFELDIIGFLLIKAKLL